VNVNSTDCAVALIAPELPDAYARAKLEIVEAAAAIPTEPNTALQSTICPVRLWRVVIPNGP
jgi:hypothetical protein